MKREVYYNNAVIKTPRAYDVRNVRLVLDSRERNMVLFPNPNKYEVNLLDAIPNVSRIRLVSSTFPFSSYLINVNNNVIYFGIGNVQYTASIEIGDYTSGDELATAMSTAMSTSSGKSFVVEYILRTDNFRFKCDVAFTMTFKGNAYTHSFNQNTDYAYKQSSVGPVVGFGIKDYTSRAVVGMSSVNIIQSEFRKNFNLDSGLVVNIEMCNLNKSTSMAIDESFAIISKTGPCLGQSQLYDGYEIEKIFTPSVKSIVKMKVSITDYYGNPYDFQNQNHRMEFVLRSQIIQHP